MTDITINEALYIDPRSGSDKFYRTFAFGSIWLAQYGRNGQVGTFTKPVNVGSNEAAIAAAAAKFAAKIKKGYQPSRSGVVSTESDLPADLTMLDQFAGALPTGSANGLIGHQAPAAVELDLEPAPDISDLVNHRLTSTVGKLGLVPGKSTAPAPLRPMLATGIDQEAFLELADNDDWVAQFKYDGDRIVIVIDEGTITVLNRSGQSKTRGISSALLHPFTALSQGRWAFDGEIVDRDLVLFDLIEARSDQSIVWVDPTTPFSLRYQALAVILTTITDSATLGNHGFTHNIAPLFRDAVAKRDALHQAKAQHREGLILRDGNAPYEQGRRSTRLLKYKFTHTADVIIDHLATDKASARLTVLAPDANGIPVPVGNASTIGKGTISPGEVWEVEFLYVINPDHPRMVQPRLLRRRDDKPAHECTLDQFATAGTNHTV